MRVGETYLVRVPARLPYERFPPDTTDPEAVLLHWRRLLRAGEAFELTVTDLPEPDGEHMVAGVLVAPHCGVRVKLTDDQAVELGLPPGVGYVVTGTLTDLTGTPVELMTATPMTVPVRWLHPARPDGGAAPP
ncbi:hypothetical protein ACFWA9_04750 [Kitasatospora sp. NPDC059973]|uniref:hypothetical protein n=1 Tax=Kitasatospora sp. NPDC059973 TaxID=3347020 RepID=UPI00369C5D3B